MSEPRMTVNEAITALFDNQSRIAEENKEAVLGIVALVSLLEKKGIITLDEWEKEKRMLKR